MQPEKVVKSTYTSLSSTEHRELFKKLVEEKAGEFAKRYGVDYNITFSEQKPSTDTIAADMENNPFRARTVICCSVRVATVL